MKPSYTDLAKALQSCACEMCCKCNADCDRSYFATADASKPCDLYERFAEISKEALDA